jgi:hypothetical protein
MNSSVPSFLMCEHPSQIHTGDCLQVLAKYPTASVDLIVTSPPYADQRKGTYGGVHPNQYVEWFMPRAAQMLRVLKPTDSFVLNIKEKAINGERHTYVLELIIALRKQGCLWTEEYVWHKRNCFPGKWPNRFRDAWERCLHFTKERKFKMNQEAVMVPMGGWANTRLKSWGKTTRCAMTHRWAIALRRTLPTGASETWPTPAMCSTWPLSVATRATVRRCRNGSFVC